MWPARPKVLIYLAPYRKSLLTSYDLTYLPNCPSGQIFLYIYFTDGDIEVYGGELSHSR